MTRRAAAIAATAGLAVAVFIGPWFALFRYTPNGWHATWWARLALLAALINIGLLAYDRLPRTRVALAAIAAAAIALRVIWPPDFGLAFDGLDVPTARRGGIWVALGLALIALGLDLWLWLATSRARRVESSESRSSGRAPA